MKPEKRKSQKVTEQLSLNVCSGVDARLSQRIRSVSNSDNCILFVRCVSMSVNPRVFRHRQP